MPAMKKKKRSFGISIGSSSILVVFVVLCLTTFATLSLVSAHADYRLSRKTADAVASYYALDSAGEELVADLAAVLREARPAQGVDETVLREQLEKALETFARPSTWDSDPSFRISPEGVWILSYAFRQADGWQLFIQLDITERYRDGREDAPLRRLCWQAVPPGEEPEESSMPLFQPGNLPVG